MGQTAYQNIEKLHISTNIPSNMKVMKLVFVPVWHPR